MQGSKSGESFGWSKTILRIDLSKKRIQKQPLPEEIARKFIGGMGLADKIIWDYMVQNDIRTRFDPLSPENIFVIAEGPLTGAATSGGRGMYQFISPATGHLGGGSSGGFVHAMIKQAGYDAVVLTGKANKPVYVVIEDDKVDIKDASEIWGEKIQRTVSKLRSKYGEVSTIVIGPAGENLVRHATALADGFKSGGGKCGTGAVLGSKNVKAIVVRGEKGVKVANPKDFIRNDSEYRKALKENGAWPFNALWLAYFHTMPFIPSLAQHIYDYAVRYKACWNCNMGCCGYHEHNIGSYRTRGCGPEITNQVKFFPLGVKELEPLNYLSDLMNDYGLDWDQAPSDIGMAMKLYHDGIITKKDTNGIELKSGDYKAIEEMIHLMVKRERIGDLIAEGKTNIARIVPEARKYDDTVRGTTGYPQDDPRKSRTKLGPAVMCHFTPYRGACLQAWGWQSPYLSYYNWKFPGKEGLRTGRGYNEEDVAQVLKEVIGSADYDLFRNGDPKGWCKLNVRVGNWAAVTESLILCRRITCILDKNITPVGIPPRMVSAATGMEFTFEELEEAGERIVNLQRMIDARLGISRKQDKFSEYFYQSEGEDVRGLTAEDEKTIKDAMDYYYTLRGWDLETGQPSRAKADQLGLQEELKGLEKGKPYADWGGPPLPKWNL